MNTTKIAPALALAPHARTFDWDANNMAMRYMVCRLHPECKYLTKHYFDRSWHYVSAVPECECSPEELVVLTDEKEAAEWN